MPARYPLKRWRYNQAPEVATVKLTPSKIAVSAVGIIQSLANHDPDLDAIYRLTQASLEWQMRRGANLRITTQPWKTVSPTSQPNVSVAPYSAQTMLVASAVTANSVVRLA